MEEKRFSSLYLIWRHPHLKREEIISYQNKQLRRIVGHAYGNVPYYRRLFDQAKISPSDIKTISDLPSIPLTSKKDLKNLPEDQIIAKGFQLRHLVGHRTTGSTGEPFVVWRSSYENFLFHLFRMRAMAYFGLKSRDRVVRVRYLGRDPLPLSWRILQSLGRFRLEEVNILDTPEHIVEQLKEKRPDVVTGSAGMISRVAQFMISHDIRSIQPRFLAIGAEVVTPLMKGQIREAFKAPVYEMYECEEIRSMAWECKYHGGYHVCDDNLILEVLKGGSPAREGERGEVVVTSFHSFAMPRIRYRLEDVVTKGTETCPCGAPFSTIEKIQGRMKDDFYLPGGRELDPYALSTVFIGQNQWISSYEIVQERFDKVILRIVPSDPLPQERVQALRERIQLLLGDDVELEVEFVSEIKPGPGGKLRSHLSLVRSQYEGHGSEA